MCHPCALNIDMPIYPLPLIPPRFCRVSSPELGAQIKKLLPIAVRIQKTEGKQPFDAWIGALQATQTPRTHKLYPCTALGPVLQMWAAYTPSSSGVEQSFSKCSTLANNNREILGKRIMDDLHLVAPRQVGDDEIALKEARRIWVRLYGVARSVIRRPRLDKGMTRAKQDKSESSWLRKRRREVETVTQKHKQALRNLDQDFKKPVVGEQGWSASLEKEACFQENKRAVRLLAAIRAGEVSPSCKQLDELSTEALQYALTKQERAPKLRKNYARKHKQHVDAARCVTTSAFAPTSLALLRTISVRFGDSASDYPYLLSLFIYYMESHHSLNCLRFSHLSAVPMSTWASKACMSVQSNLSCIIWAPRSQSSQAWPISSLSTHPRECLKFSSCLPNSQVVSCVTSCVWTRLGKQVCSWHTKRKSTQGV